MQETSSLVRVREAKGEPYSSFVFESRSGHRYGLGQNHGVRCMVARTAAQSRGPENWRKRSSSGAVARRRLSKWAEVAMERDDGYREVGRRNSDK
jgi:hypothetical protein